VKCVQPRCHREAATGEHLCTTHERMYDRRIVPTSSSEYQAARLDPTTDRDRWDLFDEDGAA
jgi:hypothetical protein